MKPAAKSRLVIDVSSIVTRAHRQIRGSAAARNGGALTVAWSEQRGVFVRRLDAQAPTRLASENGKATLIVPALDGFLVSWESVNGNAEWSDMALRLDPEATPIEKPRNVRLPVASGGTLEATAASAFVIARHSLIVGQQYGHAPDSLWRIPFDLGAAPVPISLSSCPRVVASGPCKGEKMSILGLAADPDLQVYLVPWGCTTECHFSKSRHTGLCMFKLGPAYGPDHEATVCSLEVRPDVMGYVATGREFLVRAGGEWRLRFPPRLLGRAPADLEVAFRNHVARLQVVGDKNRRALELTILDAAGSVIAAARIGTDAGAEPTIHTLSAFGDELWFTWAEEGRRGDVVLRATRAAFVR